MPIPADIPGDREGPLLDDRSALLASVGGQLELLREIVAIYLEAVPRLLGEVQAALAHGDRLALFHAAHKLAGTVTSFYSSAASASAILLAEQGRAGDLPGAADTVPALERRLRCLAGELQQLLAEVA